METATGWIVIASNGNNVLRKGLTPAECIIIKRNYKKTVGGNPVTNLEITGEAKYVTEWDEEEVKKEGKVIRVDRVPKTSVTRSSAQEYSRLVAKYGEKKMAEAFPGDASGVELPETFKKAGFDEGVGFQQEKAPEPTRFDSKIQDDEMVFAVGPAAE